MLSTRLHLGHLLSQEMLQGEGSRWGGWWVCCGQGCLLIYAHRWRGRLESQVAELCFGNGLALTTQKERDSCARPYCPQESFFGLREADFPGGPAVKNPPCCAGDAGSIPGWGS